MFIILDDQQGNNDVDLDVGETELFSVLLILDKAAECEESKNMEKEDHDTEDYNTSFEICK